MKTTVQYVDELREKLGLPSDYAVAKKLEITRSAVSAFRTGKSRLDDMTAARLADLIGVEPMEVIAAAHHERARNEDARSFWLAMWEKSGGLYRENLEAVKGWQVGHPKYQGEGLW